MGLIYALRAGFGSEKHGLKQSSDAARQPLFRAQRCLAHHPPLSQFQKTYRECVEAASSGDMGRDDRWFESIAIGSEGFVKQVKNELGLRAQHRQVFGGGLFESRCRLMATISTGEIRL
jgi:hypothetical protein